MEQETVPQTVLSEPAWEKSSAGIVSRYFATIKGMIPRCDFFFEKFDPVGNGARSATIFLAIGSFFAALAHTLLAVFVLPRFGIEACQGIAQNAALHVTVRTIGLTLAILIACVVSAFIQHLLLSGNRFSFVTTYRVAAYSFGVAVIFSIIPLYGLLLTGFLGYVYQIYGLTQQQKVTGNRACFAVLLIPIILILAFTLWYNSLLPLPGLGFRAIPK
ncbi:MAG: hypothetical protein PHX74_09720 [Candidatus Sumerlaeales bacterium]|nr:hypothetical protein [Candidatus Sumerlaeales bacterium]